MSDSIPAPKTAPVAADHADAATIPDDHADDFSRAPSALAPSAPVAHEVAPAQTAANELAGLVPQGGGSAITVMLALIAVAGGGAGWKFYQSFAKQKHEQRMKELELKEKKIELQAEHTDKKDDHKACEAARAADRAALVEARTALEEKLAALEARLAEAEKAKDAPKADDVDLPFDPEELNERISQIEKALKKAPSEKKPSDKKAKKDAKG